MDKLAKFIIHWRWPIILAFLGSTVFFAAQIRNARFNTDMLTYLPDSFPARRDMKQIESIFGGTDLVMVVLQTNDVINGRTLERVRSLSLEMKKIPGIEKVISLFDLKQVRSQEEAITVDPAISKIPRTPAEKQAVKSELVANDMVYGSIVAKDFSATAVIGMLEPGTSDQSVIRALEKLVKKIPGAEKVILGGPPYMRTQNGDSLRRDLSRLLPLGILVMLVFLLFSFRQARGVLLPMAVVLASICIALGSIPLLGWEFTVVTLILPVLLISVTNNFGVHMVAHYQDDNSQGGSLSKEEMARRMVTCLGKPILIGGLTTVAGLLCMLGHVLIPAWQMGVIGAVGIGAALLASLFFIPAISSLLPKPVATPVNNGKSNEWMNRLLVRIGSLVTGNPRRIIIVLLAVTLALSLGIIRLSTNTNPARIYPAGHPARISADLINRDLGGFFSLAVVFAGDVKDPGLMKKIDRIEREIGRMPHVGVTQSIAKVMRQISRALNRREDRDYDRVPESRDAVSQYLELYMMGGDPQDLEKMVDFSFQNAMILIRFKELNTPVLRECVRRIKEMVQGEPEVKWVGGIADTFSEMDKRIVSGQFLSLALSLLVVFIGMYSGFRFRSFRVALLQTTSLVMATLMLFGIMGLAGIELNFVTALLSSILIGLGDDYTVHMVWRYREERKTGLEAREAMRRAVHTSGRGIILNALSIMVGFAVLLFSSFLSVKFFGFLMVAITFTCLVGGMLLVPSLCLVLSPKFLEASAINERGTL